MKKLLLASTSTIYGSDYLTYLLPQLIPFFEGVTTLLFIPYARPGGISYDAYTTIVKDAFSEIDIAVKGIHEFSNPKEAVENATSIFTGGGNTFELVSQLYKNNLMDVLQEVLENGTPYLGTSAGSNICGLTMMNTNDMPIVYPPSFTTLGVIPFNINAHYLEVDKNSKHMGESRATRIKEFHVFNTTAVLGLREGSWLEVVGDVIQLKGTFSAKWFQQNKDAVELLPGSTINVDL